MGVGQKERPLNRRLTSASLSSTPERFTTVEGDPWSSDVTVMVVRLLNRRRLFCIGQNPQYWTQRVCGPQYTDTTCLCFSVLDTTCPILRTTDVFTSHTTGVQYRMKGSASSN